VCGRLILHIHIVIEKYVVAAAKRDLNALVW
jgi:hypothetical protein